MALTSETLNYHSRTSYSHFRTCTPLYSLSTIVWYPAKFRDDISNGSSVIALTDKHTNGHCWKQYHPRCARGKNYHHRPRFATYSVSQKIPLRLPDIFDDFSQNVWEFLVQILHAYYIMFLSTLDYKFLFNYLQLWRSYAILSATTQRAFWACDCELGGRD